MNQNQQVGKRKRRLISYRVQETDGNVLTGNVDLVHFPFNSNVPIKIHQPVIARTQQLVLALTKALCATPSVWLKRVSLRAWALRGMVMVLPIKREASASRDASTFGSLGRGILPATKTLRPSRLLVSKTREEEHRATTLTYFRREQLSRRKL